MRAVSHRAGRVLLLALPFLALAAFAADELTGGAGTGAFALLTLPPAAAAVYGGLVYTAIVTATTDILGIGIDAYQHLFTVTAQVTILAAVLGVSAVALISGATRDRRARELADVRTVADVAQQVLLRPVPSRLPGPVTVAVRYISATSAAQIGGDLYDVVVSAPGVRLIIGDVQGKGLPGVRTAAAVLGAFRVAGPEAPRLEALAEAIERSLVHSLTEEAFVTAVIAEISPDCSTVTLLNCGHPPPLHLGRTPSRFIEPASTGLPLGLGAMGGGLRQVTRVPFRPGDRMLFYTDGISEARDRSGAFYPLAQCGALAREPDPASALGQLSREVLRHVGHRLDDDAAMLLIQREHAGSPHLKPARSS